MMTTNLFVNANVKQLWTNSSFRILLHFFQISWGVGVLNSAIFFNSFHNRVEFGTILEGHRNLGGGFWNPQTPTLVLHCSQMNSAHVLPFYFYKVHFNIILPFMPRSYNVYPTQPSTHFTPLPHVICPIHLILHDFITWIISVEA